MKNNVKKTVRKAVIIPVTASVLTISMLTPGLMNSVQAESDNGNLQDVVMQAREHKKLKISRIMTRSDLMDLLNLSPEQLLQLKKDKIPLKQYIQDQGLDEQAIRDELAERIEDKLNKKLEDGRISQERYDEQLGKMSERIDDWLNNHEKMFRWFGRGS